ncbi:hypothetical protein DE146DRAFT_363702 [Phaeosphaeria sp. MPI-PUGE-AT-0046c]|nr:hypothetical protein DE146DRAFT_363702 [Phaeosphaeria sp. MPI-PUGE-AT-0046c]
MSKRREHTPLPGKQQGIWPSTLRGMEQPIPSFESFIRKTPPPTGSSSEKPLPPIPRYRQESVQTTRSPGLPSSLSRSSSFSYWKAPAAWDDPSTPDQELQFSPAFPPRNYAPLLPDTSPGVLDSEEPAPWPFNMDKTQHRRLDSIHEQGNRVSISSACHLSASSSRSSSPKFDEPASLPSDSNNNELAVNTTKLYSTSSDSSASPTISSPMSASEVMFRASNLSTKQKAFASLGIDCPGSQRITPENWSSQAPTPANEDPQSRLSMYGKLDTTGGTLDPNSSDLDISAKAQHLNVSLDYHSVLAGVYHEEHARDAQSIVTNHTNKVPPSSRDPAGKQRSKPRELVPRPLSWRKDLNSAFPNSSLASIDENAKRVPDSRRRYRKMTNWVPFHQPMHMHKSADQKENDIASVQTPTRSSRKGKDVYDADGAHTTAAQQKSLLPQVKDFATHLKRAKPIASHTTNRSISSSALQPSIGLTPPSAEQQTRLLRLGGGFAIVRQSPAASSPSHNSSRRAISSPLQVPVSSSYGHVPAIEIESVSRRPSSLYSQQSEAPVAPGISVNKRNLRISSSPTSPQSRSNTSSPPTSPLAHEVSFPRTPPPLSHSLNLPPGRSHKGRDSVDDERTDSANEDKSHKRLLHVGIIDMARDARDAWKKHNLDARHEKLKQSIRVLGPTDPGVTAAYVRRQGKLDGGEKRMPGFLGGGPL